MTHAVSTRTSRGVFAFLSAALCIAGALGALALCAACGSPAGSAMVNGFGSGGGGGGETVTLTLRIYGEDISGSGTGTGESPVSLSYNFKLTDRGQAPSVSIVSTSGSLVGKTVRLTLTGSDASAEISDVDYAALVAAINAAIGSGVSVSVNVGSGLTQRGSYTGTPTTAGISDIGGTNTAVMSTLGSGTEITFSAFGSENTTIPDLSSYAAVHITGKTVTVNVPSGVTLEELSFGWAARFKRALAGAHSVTFNIPSTITPVFKGEDMIYDVVKSKEDPDNEGKVISEFDENDIIFSNVKLQKDSNNKYYLENHGASNITVSDLRFFSQYPTNLTKVLGYGLKNDFTKTIFNTSSVSQDPLASQTSITPEDLDNAFLMLGIDYGNKINDIKIGMNNINLKSTYTGGGSSVNLAAVQYAKTFAYLNKNVSSILNPGTLGVSDSSNFRYAASTVPYDDTQPDGIATNPATLSGDLALWFLKKGINITNAKITGLSSSNLNSEIIPALSNKLTNVIFDDDDDTWKNKDFQHVQLNGVVTFNGDLPTGTLNDGTNLWLVINGNVTNSTGAMGKVKVIEFADAVSNIDNVKTSGNVKDIRLYRSSYYISLDGSIRSSNPSYWVYSNKPGEAKYKVIVSNTVNSIPVATATYVYLSKQVFAQEVYESGSITTTSISDGSVPQWTSADNAYVVP